MIRSFKLCALATLLCASFVLAQGLPAAPTPAPAAPAAPAPAVPAPTPVAPAAPAAPAPVAPVAPAAVEAPAVPAPAAPVAAEPAAEASAEPAAEAPVATPEPAPEPAPVAVPEPAPVVETPVAAPVAAPVAVATPSEPLKFSFGARVGAGISNFRDHKAFDFSQFGQKNLKLGPNLAASAGFVLAIEINSLFSVVPELQYSYYSAGGEFAVKGTADFDDLNEVYLYMHGVELPVLARFSFGSYYAELGPQVGLNLNARVYKNSQAKKPDVNLLSFGPSAGGGVKLSKDILLGIRGHFGILEYAKNSNGYPWAVQASITQLFF